MSTRIYRNVVVTRSPIGVDVGLYWDDSDLEPLHHRRCKFLHFYDGVVMESVEKAIDILMSDGSTTSFSLDITIRRWNRLDQNPDLFDLIADAEEPEQAFVSRYILEA